MNGFLHDVRSAVRSLTKARGFTTVAVLVFALGIGINSALFAITNALVLRPLPVDRPDRLVYLYDVWPGERFDAAMDPQRRRFCGPARPCV